uniref:Protein SSH4 n=1 Tax=Bionectria ochroleuca TaxID=29856 RepID=A0A8H7NFI9_BIOOC
MTLGLDVDPDREGIYNIMDGLDGRVSADMMGSGDAWRRGDTLQHHSRIFSQFLAHDSTDESSLEGRFFVPSYLRGSTYMRKLAEAHRTKQNESKRSAGSDLAADISAFPDPVPSGSHRGLSHQIIERQSSPQDEDVLTSLPSKWNKHDMWSNIEIQPDGRTVKYTGPRTHNERDHEASAVRAENHMPAQCGIYYYEVEIVSSKKDDTTIAVGFSTKNATLSRSIGWEPESWAYHGDDGRCFTAHNSGRHFGPPFNQGDVIGCGVNFRENTAFFTRNGVKIGSAFDDLRGKLYPAISLKKPGESIRANFGQHPFVYNINDMVKEQREKIQRDIEATTTSHLDPDLNESELLQTLVLQFLQHDGYVETARAFADEITVEKEALSLDPNAKVAGTSIKDDEDANNRQRIRAAILEGDIDKALKYTTTYYPDVLDHDGYVYFRLRCRKFVEMIRKAAQMRLSMDKPRNNGHFGASISQLMDVDENMELDEEHLSSEIEGLERSMLKYGQTLQAEYANDPRKEVSQALADIFPLAAYVNPLKEPMFSHLLDRSGRVAVAEELNSAILLSLGKSSRAALEKVYAQTTVLLEDLRQEGGVGAFVSVQDIVDDISKHHQF